jgi:Protein of unknown function (DUF402)
MARLLFEPGACVVQRNVEIGRARFVVPSVVVTDADAETRLFRRAGTPLRAARSFALRADPLACEEATQHEVLDGHWEFVDATWSDTDTLVVSRRDGWFSTWLLWRAGSRDFTGYYVNFERPWTRTPIGFDSTDLAVDLVVTPALEPAWKDLVGFDQRIALGLIGASEAESVRRSMRMVEERIAARAGVFDGSLVDWKPEPDWPVPQLPDAWDAPAG